jgi:integrase
MRSVTLMPPSHFWQASTLKVVSEILGHSGIGITGDTYSHVAPMLEAQAAETGSKLILGR